MAWSCRRHGSALLVRVCCFAAVLVVANATVQVWRPTTSGGYHYSMRGPAARRFSRAVISPSSQATICQASGCSRSSSSSGDNVCCNGICVDVSKSVQSCGACNNACAFNRECCSGVCVDTQASDRRNCGSCGRVCAEGVPCLLGMCGYSR